MVRLSAAALAVLVIAVWTLGVAYAAPTWITWGNFAVGVVALASLATLRTVDVAGFATWPLVAMVLLAMWLFGLRGSGSHALAWLDLFLAIGFIAITGVALSEGFSAPRRHLRGPREVYRT